MLALCNPMDCILTSSSVHAGFSSKNTGVGCHAPQGIFLMQGLNTCLLCLLPWQAVSVPLTPPGKPYNLVVKKPESPEVFWNPDRCITRTKTVPALNTCFQ